MVFPVWPSVTFGNVLHPPQLVPFVTAVTSVIVMGTGVVGQIALYDAAHTVCNALM